MGAAPWCKFQQCTDSNATSRQRQHRRMCLGETGQAVEQVCAGVSDVTRSGGLCGSCMLVWLGEEACELCA